MKILPATASLLLLLSGNCLAAADETDLLAGHPRESYRDVKIIDALETALRQSLADRGRYSFSRGWWEWDRLRARYVDGGRKDAHALKILRAVFRALILDWHRQLEAKGEGDLLYIFFTTNPGNKGARKASDGRVLVRDLHGGGYHGGWGSAARMRIYEELANQGALTAEEKERFRKIVYQSLEAKILDFNKGAQTANNHSFGNAGGVAMALKLFPDAPQALEARAWLDRIWRSLDEFGDWTEWTYYPYGPIFLHGMIDVAEATGKIESDRDLIRSVGARCLTFVHGGGVRGNPNSGAKVRKLQSLVYADPWDVGYYDVETSSRDAHFWYRMAQHFQDAEYLWAAEQVALGGRPPNGQVTKDYRDAYKRRFAWFIKRGIRPKLPDSRASIGLLSARKKKIPERLFLNSGRDAGKPFAAYFLYDKKDEHLDNVSGHLYEYSVHGTKFLHSSGKYNNVYSADKLKGGGTGEESLDLLLVMHNRHQFPSHPDRAGDKKLDFMRRGSIAHVPDLTVANNNKRGDSFGQFAFDNYYGDGSRWVRRTVLTAEGYLVVADQYTGAKSLGRDYLAGPVWHLATAGAAKRGETPTRSLRNRNWFDAPAFDRAWWQKKQMRVVLLFHDDGSLKFGSLRQTNSQDVDPNVTTFAYRPINGGRPERFLSVFVPYRSGGPDRVAAGLKTAITEKGEFVAVIRGTTVTIDGDGGWSVGRQDGK